MGRKSGKIARVKQIGRRPSSAAVNDATMAPPPDVAQRHASTLLGGLLLAPALLPLLYVPQFFFPALAPKTFAFRSLAILVLAVLAWLVLARTPLHYGRLKRRITWIPAALLLVACATSLAGVDFYRSFWSTFERGDGLLTLAAEVVFFYAILLHADTQFLRRLAIISMAVGNLVAVIALFQWLRTQDRVGATLGNAAFMASFLGMTFFFTLWYARHRPGWRRHLAIGGALLHLLAIVVFSSTRGTIVALGVAAILAAVFAAWKLQGRTRRVARVSLAAIAIMVALFFGFRAQLAQVPFMPVQRLAQMSPTGNTGAVRLILWKNLGLQGMHHPVTGVGAEHVDGLYNLVYRPYVVAEWIDRSHNAFLDYFVQFGIAGALLYLGLVLAALQAAYAAFQRGNELGGFLCLMFLTYAVQNIFVFDTSLTLWLFLAALASLCAAAGSATRSLAVPRLPLAVRALPVLAVAALLVPVTVQPVRANLLLMKAYSPGTTDVAGAAGMLKQGLALHTCADLEYGYYAYQMYASPELAQANGGSRMLDYQTTVDILHRNFVRYPYDARTAAYLAHVMDLTPAQAAQEDTLFNAAIDRAIRLSPGRVEAWYFRVNIDVRQGDAAAAPEERDLHYLNAIAILDKYLEAYPERSDPHYVIAGLYLSMGDMARAKASAALGDAAYLRHIDYLGFEARKAGRYYLKAADWARAAEFYGVVARENPTEYATLYILAKAKYLAGDKAGAKDIVNRLRAESPATIATDPGFAAKLDAEQAPRQ